MRTRLVLAALVLAYPLAWASPRCAGADPVPSGTKEAIVTLDPAQTRIDFTLPGALHTTHGSFRLQSGTISVHPRSGKAGGKIVVDAASGDTGNSMRDARMKDNILEVGPYPEIVFVPKTAIGHLDPQGVFHGQLNGTLSLHGGSHDLDGRAGPR